MSERPELREMNLSFIFKDNKNKDLFLLTIIYFLSQLFLLLVSGRWWDDWCAYNQPFWLLKEFSLQLGRPDTYYIASMMKNMPDYSYRVITFFMFYGCMVFFYKILKNWLCLNSKACFWISALYATLPANDARIMFAVFPYTLGIFFFMAGLFYLTDKLRTDVIYWWDRIAILLLFLCSFTLNSNLFFFLLAIISIFMKERNIKRLITRYIDFLLLPVVYFVIKTVCFPPSGMYSNYNAVTIASLLGALKYLIQADIMLIHQLVLNCFEIGTKWVPFASIPVVFVFLLAGWKKSNWLMQSVVFKGTEFNCSDDCEKEKANAEENIKILLIGVIMLSSGLYPYIVVRQSYEILTTGFPGKDSILAIFGAAMVIYALIILLFKRRIAIFCYNVLIISGIVFFNRYYLFYQQDYYRMLGFQYRLSQHQEISSCSNIVYINEDNGLIKFSDIYVLNANAEEVFGNQKRIIINGFKDARILLADKVFHDTIDKRLFHMKDYHLKSKKIDALITYSFECKQKDIIKMRFYELTNKNKFEHFIKQQSAMNVYLLNAVEGMEQ